MNAELDSVTRVRAVGAEGSAKSVKNVQEAENDHYKDGCFLGLNVLYSKSNLRLLTSSIMKFTHCIALIALAFGTVAFAAPVAEPMALADPVAVPEPITKRLPPIPEDDVSIETLQVKRIRILLTLNRVISFASPLEGRGYGDGFRYGTLRWKHVSYPDLGNIEVGCG